MSKENNELLLIKVLYLTHSTIIGENIFSHDVTLKDIIFHFNTNFKTEYLNLKKKYTYNGIPINENKLLKELVNIPKGKSYIIEIKIEVNENEIFDDESEPIISKIIKPKFYPFSLFVYSPKEGRISLEEYTSNIVKEYNLKKITSGSSYCNSPDSLFISGGGVYYENSINDFWIINKEDYSIEKRKMPLPRRDHSMIYIPNNLILIAGGGDAKCFIFDIQKKIFFKWADLNDSYSKPALLSFNNYIYCFSKLTQDKDYFEKTNISSKYPKWEKIFPKFNRKVYLYNKKIFCVSKTINNLIIIGAGDNIRQSKLYVYNLKNNEISILEGKFELEELDNKSFDKVSKFYNISIPKNFDRERNIILLNKKKKQIKKIYFSNSDNINKIKITEEQDYPNEEGTIKIQIKPLNNSNINTGKIKNDNLEENKLNIIKKNIEDEKKEILNKNNLISNRIKNNNDFLSQNNTNNLIEEISEDDEEKYDEKVASRTIPVNKNHNKFHISNKIGYIPKTNKQNINNNYFYNNNNNNEEINKDLQFGDNEEFFNNKNEKIMEDDIQLSRIIKRGDEFDTLDKMAVTERSILNQIGSGKKGMNNSEKKNISKRMNKLPQVKPKNIDNKSLLLNNNNYIIDNEKGDNYKNNYSLNNNNNKDEDTSIKIE